MMIHEQLKIKGLVVDPPLLLAPMAGLTHSALRTLLVSFGGVGLLSTEMLSARRLPSENPAVSPYLVRTEAETPLSYQLLVTDVREVGPAVEALHRFGADAIDLNLGCPAPKVRKAGGGSSLMNERDRVQAIVAAARRLTHLPLSAKIRLGETLDPVGLDEFCRMLEGEGIDFLTVHARLRGESFTRKPRWDQIARVKERVGIPVIANGSVYSVDTARECLRISGADGLMIGRAAAERPWVFAEIAQDLYGSACRLPGKSRPEIYHQFVQALTERFRPERRLGRLKEFTHYFARNYAFGHQLASGVQASRDISEAWSRALDFFRGNEPGFDLSALTGGDPDYFQRSGGLK